MTALKNFPERCVTCAQKSSPHPRDGTFHQLVAVGKLVFFELLLQTRLGHVSCRSKTQSATQSAHPALSIRLDAFCAPEC